MQLTDLQLEIMKLWSSKELSFGCIVEHKSYWYWYVLWNESYKFLSKNWTFSWFAVDKIIWHPITRWRLCYLRQTDKSEDTVVNWVKQKMEKWINLCWNFENNPELYNQNILTRNEDVLNLVRDFLLSIQ